VALPTSDQVGVPIGKPIQNTHLYILDANLNLCPIGVKGEICVAGLGVGRGYWKNEALTKRVFIANPVLTGPGAEDYQLVYRTGDQGYYQEDGHLMCSGRVDNQVKIRGNRIELGEIESRLSACPGVEQAVVALKEREGDKYLVGYYQSEQELPAAELRAFLARRLPDYMLPGQFVRLRQLPLTPNGKLDRKALPDVDLKAPEDYLAPANPIEEALVDIWQQVLGVEKVGVIDNFFAVGGDSIKSILISARLRSAGYKVTINDIFTSQTIRELARKVSQITVASDQQPVTGTAPLTPIQQLFFEKPRAAKHHYNQSVMLRFPRGIAASTVERIFTKLQVHHDALRMVFQHGQDGWRQYNKGTEADLSLEEFDLREWDLQRHPEGQSTLEKLAGTLQAGIDLGQGPLMKLGLFHSQDGSRLLIVIHHLVVDGISWRILFEDVETLYQQVLTNQPLALPPKTDSFLSWPARLAAYTESQAFRTAGDYWASVVQKPVGSIVRDNPSAGNLLSSSATETFALSREVTTRLVTQAHAALNTQLNDLLLAALLLAVHRQYGHHAVRIDLEGHGREEIEPGMNVSRTIGWFTSLFPVVLEHPQALPGQRPALGLVVKQVKEALREVPNKGVDYLLCQQRLAAAGDPAGHFSQGFGTAQIRFNYLGQFDADVAGKSFIVTQEAKGPDISPYEAGEYDWEIVGMVSEGQLKISLSFGQQYYRQTIAAFMQAYEESLRQLIDYCCAYGTPELTPSDLTYRELTIGQLEELQRTQDLQNIYPLSPMQEGLLFQSLVAPDSQQYFLQMTCRLEGQPDIAAVEKSMNILMTHHEVLRTTFLSDHHPVPLQVVLKARKVDFSYRDVRAECAARPKQQLVGHYQALDKSRKFDLDKDVLMRLTVLRTADAEYELIWSFHHILIDGWCMSIIFNGFMHVYAAVRSGQAPQLLPRKPYADYIAWLGKRDREASGNYWKQYLEGYECRATLPQLDAAYPEQRLPEIASERLVIDQGHTQALHGLSSRYKVTINTILQAAWGILLAKYNDTDEVVFGSVVSGRPAEIEGIETMVGLFINTIPVRIRCGGERTFGELLREVQDKALESEPHHYHPLSQVQAASGLGRDLFNHLLVLENYPISGSIVGARHDEFVVSHIEAFEQSNYDFSIIVIPGEALHIRFEYNVHAYDPEMIRSVARHWQHLLEHLALNSQRPIADLDLLPPDEKHRLLVEFNANPTAATPLPRNVHQMFEAHAARQPGAVALRFGDQFLTYRQLNEKANQLAHYLRQKGVGPEVLVGLHLEKSFELIVGMLGILKAGGAYVPLDTNSPKGRLGDIMADAQLAIVLSSGKNAGSLPGGPSGPDVILLDEHWDRIAAEAVTDPENNTDPEDLAYLMFTSGSTGKPKGVTILHQGIVRLVKGDTYIHFGPEEVFMLVAPVTFDASTYEIWCCLCNGGNLVMIPSGTPVLEDLSAAVRANEVTTLVLITGLFHLWAENGLAELTSVRQIVTAGDLLSGQIVRKLVKNMPHCTVINAYGPTENTTATSCYAVPKQGFRGKSVPIGRPIPHTTVYVLDRQLRPVPVGAPGELYTGGLGLARDYFRQPELTAAKYIQNPFSDNPQDRLYKTGDLVRWLPDGNLDFIGRMDNQVKIRGYRVEPGEIQHQISKHEKVSEAAVVVRGTGADAGDKQIIAYVVPRKGTVLDNQELLAYLKQVLPDYMLPAYVGQLDHLPLTANGKLDRKALPDPEFKGEHDYVAPTREIEEKLVTIWAEVLKVGKERIGVNSSFFKLGGDSLKAIMLVNKIYKEQDVKIPVKEIFTTDTVQKIAEYVENDKWLRNGVQKELPRGEELMID
jgi:iturin family lipopeptide synthetase B